MPLSFFASDTCVEQPFKFLVAEKGGDISILSYSSKRSAATPILSTAALPSLPTARARAGSAAGKVQGARKETGE